MRADGFWMLRSVCIVRVYVDGISGILKIGGVANGEVILF